MIFFDKKFVLALYNSFLKIEVNCYKENHVNLLINLLCYNINIIIYCNKLINLLIN